MLQLAHALHFVTNAAVSCGMQGVPFFVQSSTVTVSLLHTHNYYSIMGITLVSIKFAKVVLSLVIC